MGKKPRTLLITANGLIGGYLNSVFKSKDYPVAGTFYRHHYPDSFSGLDITDKLALKKIFSLYDPELVVLNAALTNVDYCQNNQEEAWRINVGAVKNIVDECKNYRSKLVFFSSEYVFDGLSGPYSEEDQPNPVCFYGQNKLEAESIIQGNLKDYLIIRTTVVYGKEKQGKNFAMRLIETLKRGESVRVPSDQVSSPTYALNLAQLVEALIQKDKSGIYNVVGKDIMDRCAFALEVCSVFGLDKSKVIPVATAQLNQSAPRPLQVGLSVNKIEQENLGKVLGVKEGLSLFKQEIG